MATRKKSATHRAPRKSSTAKTARSTRRRGASASTGATIRHYCQGIGDCHLLSFPKTDGTPFYMLIDCGVHPSISGGAGFIDKVVDDIAKVTKHIDVVVMTHEHWDHNSGFLTAAEKFEQITVDEVWMGWTEDLSDAQARQLDKFKGQALALLQAMGAQVASANGVSSYLQAVHEGVDNLTGFYFGAKGERVRSAREAAKALAPDNVRYLEPKDPPILVDGLNVRIYVLGPPRDAALIGVAERASEMYAFGADQGNSALHALGSALRIGSDEQGAFDACPFDPNLGLPLDAMLCQGVTVSESERETHALVQRHYAGPAESAPPKRSSKKPIPAVTDQSWRRIDHDWLAASAELALQLDNRTNNTSLVLAFEFIDTGRVMLFAADAQVGNWLSWQDVRWGSGADVVGGPDLLARTVYYKVGHHGSQNATLKAKGLEMMTSRDLSAFIPTNQKDALKVKWGEMPFKGIVDDLLIRANGRVIRADDAWIARDGGAPAFSVPSGSIQRITHSKAFWLEVEVR